MPLSDIDPGQAVCERGICKQAFLSPTLGLMGTREHTHNIDAPGDVDPELLVNGILASASVVALVAARRHGDVELAMVLDREADLFGLPLSAGLGTVFSFGLSSVGDASVT